MLARNTNTSRSADNFAQQLTAMSSGNQDRLQGNMLDYNTQQ
jgi:hypothetical protein